jgi:hypothetical protein
LKEPWPITCVENGNWFVRHTICKIRLEYEPHSMYTASLYSYGLNIYIYYSILAERALRLDSYHITHRKWHLNPSQNMFCITQNTLSSYAELVNMRLYPILTVFGGISYQCRSNIDTFKELTNLLRLTQGIRLLHMPIHFNCFPLMQ